MKRCILIAGMHRCGTSALAGVLAHSGVDFGKNLLASKADENALGFYEDAAVLALNDHFLYSLHSSWDDTRPLEIDLHQKAIDLFQKDIQKLVSNQFSDQDIIGIKDPRFSLLFPFWKSTLESMGYEIKLIVPFRHPLEIARSLKKRNGFDYERSALLIQNYYAALSQHSADQDQMAIDYASLLSDTDQCLSRLAAWLALPFETLRATANDLVRQDLKTQTISEQDDFSEFGSAAEAMQHLYVALTAAENASTNRVSVEPIKPRLQLSEQNLSHELMLLRSELHSLQDQYNTFTGISSELDATNTRLGHFIDQFEQKEKQIADKFIAVTNEIDQREKNHLEHARQTQQTVSMLDDQLRSLESQVNERTEWLQALDREMQNDRELLVKLAKGNLRLKLDQPHIKMMVKQGVRYPHKVIPWVWRRVKNHLARQRLKQENFVNEVSEPEVDFQATIKNLHFPAHDAPDVSIVIPVYNDMQYTVSCLESLVQLQDKASFEVIVVDDASPDIDTQELSAIPNLTWIKNPENLGFIRTCNRGAEFAKGQYLLLLNNDTRVHQGCLDAMIKTFADFPDAGMVGGKLVYPDGRLQEAGGIVWKDGSAWNWGRLQDPNKPEFNYARRADYCSGALLMLPLAFYRELDGFDETYCPAYYEDTDLAFRIRETGKQVYYQPLASITHFEGVSNGTDTGSGIKQYQVVNQKKFYARWAETLKSHRNNAELPELECDRTAEQRILIIDHRMLTPDQDSGSLRMFNLFRVLKRMGHKVTFLPDNLYAEAPYTAELQAMGVEVIHTPYYRSVNDYLTQNGYIFDCVILSRMFVTAKNLDDVRQHCKKAKVIYDTVDLHFLREQREAELTDDDAKRRDAEETKTQELRLMNRTDATIVVSPYEESLLSKVAPNVKIHTVSNIHEIHGSENDYEIRKDILFIGGFEHPPNGDAVIWFVNEILPIIQKAIPDLRFHIVGSKPDKQIKALAESANNVIVHGFVDDVSELFNNIRATVAPLRYGAGVKGKVNQSLAYGVPCVATSIASEGMSLQHGKNIYVADEASQFAQGVIDVYQNKPLWETLSKGGLQNIESVFSLDAAEKALEICLKKN